MKIYKNSYISESGLTNRDIVNIISALHLDKEDKYCYIMSRNLIYRRDDVNFVKIGRIMKCFYGFFSRVPYCKEVYVDCDCICSAFNMFYEYDIYEVYISDLFCADSGYDFIGEL